MAILANPTVRTVIQIVLAVVIVILGIMLYRTIMDPAREFAREQAITEQSRERMLHVRSALMAYGREYEGYPSTLDSLETVVRTDSFFIAQRDSIFALEPGEALELDSLWYSSRGPRFEYQAVHGDTIDVWVYLLRDPATGDSIGTSDPLRAVGQQHALSWQ